MQHIGKKLQREIFFLQKSQREIYFQTITWNRRIMPDKVYPAPRQLKFLQGKSNPVTFMTDISHGYISDIVQGLYW